MQNIKGVIRLVKTFKVLRLGFLIMLAVFMLAFIGLHVLVNLKGRELLVEKLSDISGREVSIGSVTTSLPFTITIRDIEAEGFGKISRIVASGGLIDIFRKSIRLNSLSIVDPDIAVSKDTFAVGIRPAVRAAQPQQPQPAAEIKPASPAANKIIFPGFVIGRLTISGGTIHYTDILPDDKTVTIALTKVQVNLRNLDLSGRSDQITYVRLSALVPWRDSQEAGRIEADGWLNLRKKDMQATLKISDIDGVYLYPYFSKWVNLEKARIQRARLNLTSDITSKDNDLTAVCHLELADLEFQPRDSGEQREKAERIASAVLDMFRAINQGNISLDFTIHTKMSDPKFGAQDIESAVSDKLSESRKNDALPASLVSILSMPGKLVEGTVRSAADVTRAMISGSTAVGKELKNAVVVAFTKEKHAEPE